VTKKPVTITIDIESDKQIRRLQANFISSSNKNWSYSAVLNLVIEEGLKSFGVKKFRKFKT
jgi:hypothetical protein